jgi:hypothetical protein
MIEYHPNRSLFYFRGISVSLSHDSILSQNEVSDNPGAVQFSSDSPPPRTDKIAPAGDGPGVQ